MKILENSESNHTETNKSENIIVKKSTFNKLIMGIVTASIVSAFLGGYLLGAETAEPSKIVIRDSVGSTSRPALSQEQLGPQIIQNISLDDDPMSGNPNAEITIIEFSDFQCPFCAKFHAQTLPLIKENYIKSGKVNFVYRDFPITGIHPNAMPAALASECADDQGKFWEYRDMIFENQNIWKNLNTPDAINTFQEYATKLGLDSTEFDLCLGSAKYSQEVNNDLQEGQRYGVTGTPGFFVGNEKIGFTKIIGAQPFPVFQKILDEQLSR
jgi:protein-disulfide isomerase